MPRFYQPDLGSEPDSPFARDGNNKLVRRSYWLDMNDRSLVMVMTQGIGAHLTNDEKRAHLTDLKREHLIDQVCIQEILPPEQQMLPNPELIAVRIDKAGCVAATALSQSTFTYQAARRRPRHCFTVCFCY